MTNDKRRIEEVPDQPMRRRKFFASLVAAVAGGIMLSIVTSLVATSPSPAPPLGDNPYIGEITMFGGNFAPRGWALCDGQLLPISSYQALFSLLGTTYGGDGRTTFGLPDLRGRVPVHQGSGPGLSSVRLGQKGGREFNNQTVSHNHTIGSAGNNAVSTDGNTNSPIGNSHAIVKDANDEAVNAYSTAAATGKTQGAVPAATGNAGSGTQQENRQPFLAVNYIIALQGTFPSRN